MELLPEKLHGIVAHSLFVDELPDKPIHHLCPTPGLMDNSNIGAARLSGVQRLCPYVRIGERRYPN